MDTRDILLFIVTIIDLSFASAILFKNPRNRINISYGLAVVATSLWVLGIAMFRLSHPAEALPWARLYYIAAALIATYFLYFGIYFPDNETKRIRWWQHLAIHAPVLAIGALVFSPAFIAAFRIQPWGKEIVLGPAYLFYAVFWVGYMGTAFLLMLRRYKGAESLKQLQLKFVLGGTLVTAVGGSIFNLFLPLAGNYRWIWLGPDFSPVMVAAIGYAIIKHRILNIRIITTEAFAAILIVILAIQFFRAASVTEFALQGSILGASALFFWLLIRAMNREVEQREEIEKLASELSLANEELQRLDAAKSEFISIAGHQLRAPLTIIKGYTSMALEGSFGKIDAALRGALGKVLASSGMLAKLVSDLLDLSRIEAGRMHYEMKPLQLEDIVEGVLHEVEEAAREKQVTIQFENLNRERLAVIADFDKVHEVVMNLVDNAIKYAPGKPLTLRLEAVSRDARRYLSLSVRDQGIGIKSEDIPRLFAKFMRSDEAKKVRPEGMGLGLYLVKRVVEDHRGRAWVESEGLGKGSTFFVEFPVD